MGGDRWFSISFWLCCALIAVPLWSVEYLPMADLPQHAAQISIWTRWSDPAFGYREIYAQNWFTPYLFGYLLTFPLTPFMSVKAATTTIITAALIGVPLASLLLIREVRGNRWWVFAVFPSVFGFCFDWGFYNFLVGIPIALLLLLLALRYAERPTVAGGALLSVGMVFLFFVHALLFVYVSLILGATVLLTWRGWKQVLASLSPLLALVPMVLLWLYIARAPAAMPHRAPIRSGGEERRASEPFPVHRYRRRVRRSCAGSRGAPAAYPGRRSPQRVDVEVLARQKGPGSGLLLGQANLRSTGTA